MLFFVWLLLLSITFWDLSMLLCVWIVQSFTLLSSILFCEFTTVYSSICLLMGTLSYFHFLATINKVTVNISLWYMPSFLLNKYLGVEWLHYMVGIYLTFYKTARLFSKTYQSPTEVRIISPLLIRKLRLRDTTLICSVSLSQ